MFKLWVGSSNKGESLMGFIVVRQYNGVTAQKNLWQVLSRPFKTWQSAVDWMDSMQDQYPKSKLFIVSKITEGKKRNRI